jgi:hypothetical protein
MGEAWGGHRNGAIPASALYKVQGYYLKADAAHALIAAFEELNKRHGIHMKINEGYRPLGIKSDMNVRDYTKTSTHDSNQWFQYGRMKRGETPTAAYPGGSIHGWGKAVDLAQPNRNNDTVVKVLRAHGWVFDIGSEPWHCHYVGIPKPKPEPSLLQKKSWKGMQTYLKANWGYPGGIDSKAGPQTWKAVQSWLADHWLYQGAIDGIPGNMTYAALKRAGCTLR